MAPVIHGVDLPSDRSRRPREVGAYASCWLPSRQSRAIEFFLFSQEYRTDFDDIFGKWSLPGTGGKIGTGTGEQSMRANSNRYQSISRWCQTSADA